MNYGLVEKSFWRARHVWTCKASFCWCKEMCPSRCLKWLLISLGHVTCVSWVFLPCVWRVLHLSIVRLFWKRKKHEKLESREGGVSHELVYLFLGGTKTVQFFKAGCFVCKIGWGRKKDAVVSNMQSLMMKIMIEGTIYCDTIFISSLINYIVVESWKIKTCWSSTKSKSMPFI